VPGQVLAGKYRIEQILGSGGMGVVVAARHLQMKHRVALKLLQPEGPASPEAIARLLREAQHATVVQSEHVVRVTDVGALPNGRPYLVMEYLEGTDLGQLLLQRGPLPEGLAVDYLLQALLGVAAAHALGIVHRDLKPTNLFLTERADGTPVIKVLDFGISKLTKPDAALFDLTRTTGALMGSPLYMAPEQIRSAKLVDPRADIWSFGVILQQFLTGQAPFMADDLAGVLAAIIADPPRSVREYAPHVSPALDQVILKCLEKDRNYRYQNAGELALALAPFAPEESRRLVRRIVATLERSGAVLSDSAPGAAVAAISASRPSRPPIGSETPPPHSATATATATASAWTHPTVPAKGARLLKGGVVLLALTGVATLVGYKLTNQAPTPIATMSAKPLEVGAAPRVDHGLQPHAPVADVSPPPLPLPEAPPALSASAPSPQATPARLQTVTATSGQRAPHAPRPQPRPQPKSQPTTKATNQSTAPDVSDLINERH